jgi:integrase/recombinase XerD
MDFITPIVEDKIQVRENELNRYQIYYGFLGNYSSPSTIKAYKREIRKYLAFLSNNCPGLSEFCAEHSHIVSYKNELMNNGGLSGKVLSQASINRAMACLYALYEYFADIGLISINPVQRVKRFKLSKEVKTIDLSDDEAQKLLEIIPTHTQSGLLHKAVLTLLFTTGMREGEMAGLKIKNLCYIGRTLALKYFAKGTKEMTTALNPKAIDAIGAYLSCCEENGYSMEDEDYLFRPTFNPRNPGQVNKMLGGKAMNYMIRKYARKIGVLGDVRFHSGRATVIGSLLEKGQSIDRVAEFVGHANIETTKSYNKRRSKIENSLSYLL